MEIYMVILIGIAILALATFLIMTIWNKVIIKKFPLSAIQKLSFWDALALMVFVSILVPGCYVVGSKCL
jgi:hypothetical protein